MTFEPIFKFIKFCM